ncbi:MAG: protease HtpX [Chlamydiae bacterium SM23_39]|nr:MAG: protease HtpX [Chlamydiae bacterium SM23_39]
MKRIFLFVLINFLIISAISIVISIFHLSPYITHFGLNYYSLMIFCLMWGMFGALISLFLSKKMAKWLMKVNLIQFSTQNQKELFILKKIEEFSKKANLKMPEVGIYPSKEINAFATGPSKKNSLVALSQGLLDNMNEVEIEGVIAHEITHIANGDMVTMTLIQGIINAFVMFLARILAYFVSSVMRSNRNNNFSYLTYMLFVFLFQSIFMVFGIMVISFFSRKREYKADKGGSILSGKEKMIKALQALKSFQKIKENEKMVVKNKEVFQSLKISNPTKKKLFSLIFATHPPLDARIEKLRNG